MRSPFFKISLLTLVSGLLILFPRADFQNLLSTGDNGRDLFCFWATAQGQMPYADYWWVYGPLMPFYYAFFLKIFGTTVSSVLIGQILLQLISGFFIFLCLSLWIALPLSYTGALWFWIFGPDFFHTYNHDGGIALLTLMTFCLLAYIRDPREKYLFTGLAGLFLLSLVKINFGLGALFVFTGGIIAADQVLRIPAGRQKIIFYYITFSLLPLLLLAVYLFFLRGLPFYAIRQCLPYLSSDHPYNAPLGKTIGMWWQALAFNINASWPNRIFGLLIIALGTRTFVRLFQKTTETRERKKILLSLAALGFFYVMALHEYLRGLLLYRTEWAKPFSILLIFLLIGLALKDVKKSVRTLLTVTLCLLAGISWIGQYSGVRSLKTPARFLGFERGNIFVGNSPDWIDTVSRTTRFLNATLKQEETFLALPFDPLYYYLTGRNPPTRQLIFFEHINITPEQEKEIIAELEHRQVNYVLISNRAFSDKKGLGWFGKTYCPLLGRYIAENFKEIQRYGNWRSSAGWAWDHGTAILQRTP